MYVLCVYHLFVYVNVQTLRRLSEIFKQQTYILNTYLLVQLPNNSVSICFLLHYLQQNRKFTKQQLSCITCDKYIMYISDTKVYITRCPQYRYKSGKYWINANLWKLELGSGVTKQISYTYRSEMVVEDIFNISIS